MSVVNSTVDSYDSIERSTHPRAIHLPIGEIASRYLAGESENALAHAFGVSRSVIGRHLELARVAMRTQTEANRLLSEQTPIEEHRRRIKLAQDASRGMKHTPEHRRRVAKGRQRTQSTASTSDLLFTEWLKERGLSPVCQQAIGPYNVDIGAYPVAVEILGGAWHASKTIHAKRSRYILDQGWHLVFVWTHAKRSPLLESAADYVVAFAQEASGNPSSIRQYRVIRGDGYELARGQADSEHITPVATGYESNNGSSID